MKKLLIGLFCSITTAVLADGPIINVSPFMKPVLESQNSAGAQTALGFTGTTTLTTISNTATLALAPTNQLFSAQFQTVANQFAAVKTNIFNVITFGAHGDGVQRSHLTITGTAGLSATNLSSPDGTWTPSDVGDRILIQAAGGHGHALSTWIWAYNSATSVEISNTAAITFADQYYCDYGQHDDSSAIQSALNACVANGGGAVYIPHGVYLISTNFQYTNQNNAQLILPQISSLVAPNLNGSALVEIYGDHTFREWGTDTTFGLGVPPDTTVLVAMLNGNDNTSTNGFGASMFDCRPYNGSQPFNFSQGAFTVHGGGNVVEWPDNDCGVYMHDLSVITGYSPHLCAINLIGATDRSSMMNVNIIGGNQNGLAFLTNSPDGTNDYGIIPPGAFQGELASFYRVTVVGFQNAFENGIFQGYDCEATLCSNAMDNYLQSGPEYEMHNFDQADCPNGLANVRGSSAGYGSVFKIDFSSIQDSVVGESGWWTNNGHIAALSDAGGHFSSTGGQGWMTIPFTNSQGGSGLFANIVWIMGANTHLYPQYYDSQGLLHYTGPVVCDNGAYEGTNGVAGNNDVGGNENVGQSLTVGNGTTFTGTMNQNGTIEVNETGLGYFDTFANQITHQWRSSNLGYDSIWRQDVNQGSLTSPMQSFDWMLEDYMTGQNTVFGIHTNTGVVYVTSGFASYCPTNGTSLNYFNFGANGVTNLTGVQMVITGLGCSGTVIQSNTITGTIKVPSTGAFTGRVTFILQPGDALIGSGMSAYGESGL